MKRALTKAVMTKVDEEIPWGNLAMNLLLHP
jgi:fluoride ion exporter CrcB/FEX